MHDKYENLYDKVPDKIILKENFNLYKDLKFFLLKHSFHYVDEFMLILFASVWAIIVYDKDLIFT